MTDTSRHAHIGNLTEQNPEAEQQATPVCQPNVAPDPDGKLRSAAAAYLLNWINNRHLRTPAGADMKQAVQLVSATIYTPDEDDEGGDPFPF